MNNSSCYAAEQTIGDSTASITLDTSDVEVKVAPGETGYASKNISLSISNVKDYALTITAPATLSKESTSGDIDINTNSTATSWGYAYGQSGNVEDMTYTNFTGTTQTLESGNNDTTSNKTLALAASFDNNNDAGHYKANITLALTATPKVAITYTLAYNGNGTNTSDIPTNQTCTAYDNGTCTITLSSTKPTRDGYEFLGWADTSSATTVQYQPGAIITMSVNKTLYAVWKTIPFGGITTMQEMTTTVCGNSNEGDTAQLTDSRDQKQYWVTKLKDGNCWMTQNLDYNGGGTQVTDISKWNTNSASSSLVSYYDPGIVGSGHLMIGNYYGYGAAQAACPANWSLPTNGAASQNGSYAKLFTTYGAGDNTDGVSIIKKDPLYFTDGGLIAYFSNAIVDENNGYYWALSQITPRWSDADSVPGFLFTPDKIYTSTTIFRYNGGFVRCVVLGS